MVGLRAVKFTEKLLSGHVLRGIRQGTVWVISVIISIRDAINNPTQVGQHYRFPSSLVFSGQIWGLEPLKK